MKNLTILTFIVLMLTGIISSGQNRQIRDGINAMQGNNYALAIENFEKVLIRNPNDFETRLKLADCYRLIGDYGKAMDSYEKYLSSNELTNDKESAAIAFNYSDVLLRSGNIEKAKSEISNFLKTFKNNPDLQRLYDSSLFAEKEQTKSPEFPVERLSVSSPEVDYGPAFYNGNMIISSNRPSKVLSSEGRTPNISSTDLFMAEKDPLEYYREPEVLKGDVNTAYSDGTFTYSSQTKWYYITQCQSRVCAIYKGKYADGKWTAEKVNTGPPEFNYGHPTITPNGKTVYFVTDRDNSSKKGKNIWKASIDGEGNFSKPFILTGDVNTDQDEMFPYIIGDSILVFASNGHPGLGGLDLFKSELKDGSFQKPVNLGFPVNTNSDDYSALVKNNLRGLYFASKRNYSETKDDIFYHPTSFLDSLRIRVVDSKKGTPLKGASVTVKQGGEIEKDVTDFTRPDGRVVFANIQHTDCDLHEHPVLASLKGYISKTDTIPCFSKNEIVITLDPGPCVDKLFTGKVYNLYTNEKVPDAQVLLVTSSGHKDSTYTNEEGIFRFEKVPCDETITITVKKDNYFTESFIDRTPGGQIPTYEKNIGIKPLVPSIIVYFEFDSCRVLPQYRKALDNLVKLFKENPDKMIAIESHTDERGTDEYNMRLSNCRGLEVRNYLIFKGVNPGILENRDFGESMPVVKGAITDEDHQKNRRTEFRATYLKPLSGGSVSPLNTARTDTAVSRVGLIVNDPDRPGRTFVSPTDTITIAVGQNGTVTSVTPQGNPDGTVYRVQISASRVPVNANTQFSNISDLITRYGIFTAVGGGYHRYQVGSFNSPEEAENLRSLLRTRGYPGCFIVVVRN